MQSNALGRSARTAPVSLPSSRVLCHFSTIVRRQCCALKPFGNPHWNLENTESKYGKIWLYISSRKTRVRPLEPNLFSQPLSSHSACELTYFFKETLLQPQASSEQADAVSRPQVNREVLPIHCQAWACPSIVTLECTSPAKRFPPKIVNEKKFLSTQSLTFVLTKPRTNQITA